MILLSFLKSLQTIENYTLFGIYRTYVTASGIPIILGICETEEMVKTISERKKQLESILVGNIISMVKGLEYVVTDKITAKVSVKEVPTTLKGTPMLRFLGTFGDREIGFKGLGRLNELRRNKKCG